MLKLSAALALAMGTAFNELGQAPVIRRGKHRTTADSKAGRQMTSRQYGSTNSYTAATPCGARECERRRRKMQTGEFAPAARRNEEAA